MGRGCYASIPVGAWGPTFTLLIGDTVSVTTWGHQRNAIEFAGKPMMAQH